MSKVPSELEAVQSRVIDRGTRCVLSWDFVPERTTAALQACLERAPQAKQYYSDASPVYDT